MFKTVVTDQPQDVAEQLSPAFGVPPEVLLNAPFFQIGSVEQITEKALGRRTLGRGEVRAREQCPQAGLRLDRRARRNLRGRERGDRPLADNLSHKRSTRDVTSRRIVRAG